jgi:hypothetical protein
MGAFENRSVTGILWGLRRRVWLSLPLFIALACPPSAVGSATIDCGFATIFDGKTLDGWSGKNKFWSVRDGAITGETTEANPTKGNTFLIFKDEVSDFELRLKVKILSGNSGIQYRSIDVGNSEVHGYQADVDSTEKYLGDLYDEGGSRGILAKGGEKVAIGVDGKKSLIGAMERLERLCRDRKRKQACAEDRRPHRCGLHRQGSRKGASTRHLGAAIARRATHVCSVQRYSDQAIKIGTASINVTSRFCRVSAGSANLHLCPPIEWNCLTTGCQLGGRIIVLPAAEYRILRSRI